MFGLFHVLNVDFYNIFLTLKYRSLLHLVSGGIPPAVREVLRSCIYLKVPSQHLKNTPWQVKVLLEKPYVSEST